MHFADKLACMMPNNVWNEVVTIHSSQEVLKMLSLYTYMFFAIVSLNTGTTILLALTAHQTPPFTGWSWTLWVKYGFCELQ
jgi:hypothetical protein